MKVILNTVLLRYVYYGNCNSFTSLLSGFAGGLEIPIGKTQQNLANKGIMIMLVLEL